ncbi:MAG TPA: hypothetical protein VMY42_10895 [Thermoguttaceae bacterium]|nr:hypothetical protein [Thermoguttaceae bacterium]
MPSDTLTPPLLTFPGVVELQAAAAKQPRIDGTIYSGGLMSLPGWGPVVIDLAGADVAADVPVLVGHQDDLDSIAGSGRAVVNAGRLLFSGILTDATPGGAKVIALGRAKVNLQASVGYMPDSRVEVRAGEAFRVNNQDLVAPAGGATIIRSGRLREVSIVAVGADSANSVTISAKFGDDTMNFEQWIKANGMVLANLREDQTARLRAIYDDRLIRAGGVQAVAPPAFDVPGVVRAYEMHVSTLQAKAAEFTGRVDSAKLQPLQATARRQAAELKAQALSSEWPAPRLEAEYIKAAAIFEADLMRAERPKGVFIHASTRDLPGGEPTAMLQAALLCHLGSEDVAARAFGDQITQSARDMRATSLVEILQAAFHANGQEPPRDRTQLIRAAFSTASIANIVSGTQNKILLDQWARLPLSCLTLCRRVSATDFKESKAVRLIGRNAMFGELGPAGEIKHGYFTDSAATYQISTYAKMYAITRPDIINDDLSALDELPRIIARGAGLKMESVFWTLVLGNASSHFSEANGNLITDVLGLDGLGVGVKTMRNLVDEDGEPILVEPKHMVVPPALEALADSLFASTNVVVGGTGEAVTTSPGGNVYGGKYRPQVVPYISNANYTGNSTTQWYLFAQPGVGPSAFIAAFLNGLTTPVVEQADADFNTLGVQYRGYADFGFACCDPQGAVKSTGAGA